VFFVQRDDMVKHLAPATAHPAFRQAVLPRRLRARSFGLQPRRLQEGDEVGIEFRVAVENGYRYGPTSGKASRNCWTTHSEVG